MGSSPLIHCQAPSNSSKNFGATANFLGDDFLKMVVFALASIGHLSKTFEEEL